MLRRIVGASALAVALVCAGALPAWAHVTVTPDSAPQGASDIEITFRVPNEETTASTTKLQIAVPSNPPLLNAKAQSVAGWTASVMNTHLAKPIHTDDGDFSEVVSQVTWTADTVSDGIKPNDFGKFELLVGTLPSTGNQIEFKALQTYSNGDIVRWIETQTPGGPTPDHPAPILQLTAPTGSATPTTTATGGGAASGAAKTAKDNADTAKTIGIIALIVGVLALAIGGVALATRRRAA